MEVRADQRIHQLVMLGRHFPPGRKAVAGAGGQGGFVVHIENAALPRPGMAETVDDQDRIA